MDFSDLPPIPSEWTAGVVLINRSPWDWRGSSESPSSMVAPPSNANTLSLQR